MGRTKRNKPIKLADAAKARSYRKRDKKVIYILESSGLTGGVRTIFDQANLLYHNGWDVEFLSGDLPPKWFQLDKGIRWETLATYEEIISAMKMQEKALKVATWWKTAFAVKEGSYEHEGLYYVQDIESHYYCSYAMQQQVQKSYDLGLTHFTNSTYADEFLRNVEKPVTYIGLWFPVPKSYTVDPSSTPYVLSTQRRQHIKGFTTLAEFARRFATAYPKTALMTYSTEPATKMAFNHFHAQSPSDEDVDKLFSNAQAYVCPSNHEGTGMPIIQSMMHKVPVATTQCGGNEKFCLHEETALVVPVGDAKSLVEQCSRLLSDHELVYRLTRNAYSLSTEMFSRALWSSRTLEFFERRWQAMV